MRRPSMRRIALLVAALTVVAFVPSAKADHKPKSYCSESGDVCISSRRVNGVVRLNIGLAAKYFNRYRLCVVAPDESRDCIKRRITDQGSSYGDSVKWAKHFPDKGEGAYKAIWRQGGNRLGKVLGFHV
jgi:hypothetical protein